MAAMGQLQERVRALEAAVAQLKDDLRRHLTMSGVATTKGQPGQEPKVEVQKLVQLARIVNTPGDACEYLQSYPFLVKVLFDVESKVREDLMPW